MDKSDLQECLFSLYLRLNGYFNSGYIVHSDVRNRTEMDVLAVRFPLHKETERDIQSCPFLDASNSYVDLVVGEVKGGFKRSAFNMAFRESENSVRSVLQRFGVFEDEEIDEYIPYVISMLSNENYRKSTSFPTIINDNKNIRLRFILAKPDLSRDGVNNGRYIFGSDILDYISMCFCPESKRELCDTRYDFNLWGRQYSELVRFFKSRNLGDYIDMSDLYDCFL